MVDPRPAVLIAPEGGRPGEDTRWVLGEAIGALFTHDGQIAVPDRAQSTIWIFSPDGALIDRRGRLGTGPGEFQHLGSAARGSAGEFLGWDPFRMTVVSLVGDRRPEALRIPLSPGTARTLRVLGRGSDGRIVLIRKVGPPLTGPREPVVGSSYYELLGVGPTGDIEMLHAPIAGRKKLILPRGERATALVPLPNALDPEFGMTARGPVILNSTRDSLFVHDVNRDRVEVLGLERFGEPLTTGARAEIVDRFLAARGLADARSAVSGSEHIPATRPAFGRLVVDLEGRLWLRLLHGLDEEGSRWLVLSKDLRVLTVAHLPARFELHDALGDRVLGIRTSPLGLHEIRVHRMVAHEVP